MIIIFITKEYINPHVKRKIKAPIPIDLIVVSENELRAKILSFYRGEYYVAGKHHCDDTNATHTFNSYLSDLKPEMFTSC